MDHRAAAASALRELAREAGVDPGDHPPPERLLACQAGELPPDQAAELREHLIWCPECARMTLELSGAVTPQLPEGEPLSDGEVAALWPAVGSRLPREAPPAPLTPVTPFPGVRVEPGSPAHGGARARFAWGLAASLLLTTSASAFWALALRRENLELTAPRANVMVRDLVPVERAQVLRELEEGSERVPEETAAVLLVLNLSELRPYPAYRAELLDADAPERLLWATEDLARSPRGNFTLEVPRPFPGSGRYRIRLFGLAGARRELLAEYATELRPE